MTLDPAWPNVELRMIDRTEIRLARYLRLLGTICLTALLPTLMPFDWIASSHAWLGFGEFPSAPIAEYLARATSAIAFVFGGLLWMLARDVRRNAPVIRYLMVATLVLAVVSLSIGMRAGLPPMWLVVDAAGAWLFCVPMLFWASQIH